MSSSNRFLETLRREKKEIIKIETIHCSLYDYMVLYEMAKIGDSQNYNENIRRYYTNIHGNDIVSIIQQDNGKFYGDLLNFSQSLGVSFQDVINNKNNLIVIPTFIGEDNFNQSYDSLKDFLEKTKDVESYFKDALNIAEPTRTKSTTNSRLQYSNPLEQPTAHKTPRGARTQKSRRSKRTQKPSRKQTAGSVETPRRTATLTAPTTKLFTTAIKSKPFVYYSQTNSNTGNTNTECDNNVYFLPCILKKSNKTIKSETDYIEELQKEIYIFRRYIDDRTNKGCPVDKIQILVDPDDKISTRFYKQQLSKETNRELQSNFSKEGIEYLNKHLIRKLKSSVDENNVFRHLFDPFIEKTKKHPLYSLSTNKFKEYIKNYEDPTKKILLIANEIIQWLILGGKKPNYDLKQSEELKIFYKEIIPTNIFSFNINSHEEYEFHYTQFDKKNKGSDSFNFKFDIKSLPMKMSMKSDNKNKKDKDKIPHGVLNIIIIPKNGSQSRNQQQLYIKLKQQYSEFGVIQEFGLIEGTLFIKDSDGLYKKKKGNKIGIIRKKVDDLKYESYNASKLNRNKIKSDEAVRYFKNFSITSKNLKGFLLDDQNYVKDTPLSSQLANILSDKTLLNKFYNFCSNSPKYSESIKSDIKLTTIRGVIKGIISILFSKNTPIFVKSKIKSSISHTSSHNTQNTYFIQNYSIKYLSIPSNSLEHDDIPEEIKSISEIKNSIFSNNSNFDIKKDAFVVVDLILSNKNRAKSKSCEYRTESVLNKTMKLLKAVVKNVTFRLKTGRNLLKYEGVRRPPVMTNVVVQSPHIHQRQ